MPIGRGTALLPRRAATTAHASRSCHRRQKALAAVCAMRVLRQRANGAARCNAVALDLVQAGRVSPARTPTAAEPTRCSIAAAVSTDIDGNGLCVHRACAAAERPTHGHTQHTPVGPDTEAAAPPCVCVVRVMRQLLESERCCQMQCSGSGFGAGRSGIASTDSDGS